MVDVKTSLGIDFNFFVVKYVFMSERIRVAYGEIRRQLPYGTSPIVDSSIISFDNIDGKEYEIPVASTLSDGSSLRFRNEYLPRGRKKDMGTVYTHRRKNIGYRRG